MSLIKRLVASLSVLLLLAAPITPLMSVYAAPDPTSEACTAIGSGSSCSTSKGLDFNNVIENIINIFSGLIGLAAVIMIMVAGFKYVTAGGDSNKVSSAKNTLVYAIIGVIIAVLAQVITKYVVNGVTK